MTVSVCQINLWLVWPEWSQLFQAAILAANMDDSSKMGHLKSMVTGEAKA